MVALQFTSNLLFIFSLPCCVELFYFRIIAASLLQTHRLHTECTSVPSSQESKIVSSSKEIFTTGRRSPGCTITRFISCLYAKQAKGQHDDSIVIQRSRQV